MEINCTDLYSSSSPGHYLGIHRNGLSQPIPKSMFRDQDKCSSDFIYDRIYDRNRMTGGCIAGIIYTIERPRWCYHTGQR